MSVCIYLVVTVSILYLIYNTKQTNKELKEYEDENASNKEKI